jgi:hypothetical protein
MLKWVWFVLGGAVGSPLLVFGATTSLLLWDSRYWDNCCEGVFDLALRLPKGKWS